MPTKFQLQKEVECLQARVKRLCCQVQGAGLALSDIYAASSSGLILPTSSIGAQPDAYGLNAYTINTTGGKAGAVFQVSTPDGLPRTISSAGGGVYWTLNGRTIANAATDIRVGIQPLNASGFGTGTFDVYGSHSSTVLPAASGVQFTAVTTGSKVINNGDLIAIEVRMVTRGGVDTVSVYGANGSSEYAMPYGYYGASKNNDVPVFAIRFDDGSVAAPSRVVGRFSPDSVATYSLFTGSTPSEAGLVFTAPMSATLWGVYTGQLEAAFGDDVTVALYSDPLGTPVLVDSVQLTSTQSVEAFAYGHTVVFPTRPALVSGARYAVVFSSDNGVDMYYSNVGAGNLALKNLTALGQNWSLAKRNGGTGAFTEVPNEMPHMALFLK